MATRIGILTGGGDVPGLNSVIKSVVYRATEMDFEVLGIRRGWEGLTHLRAGPDPDPDYIRPLDRRTTRAIDRTGGTVLHTSRTNPGKMKASNLPEHLDPIRLRAYETAEGTFDLDALAELLMEDRRANPSSYAFVIASEGAIWSGGTLGEEGEADAYGHRHKTDVGGALAEELRQRTGVETVHSDLTYDLRSGDPDALDQMVAMTFANVAMDLLISGTSGRMVAIREGKYDHAPLPDPELGPRRIDVARMYNTERLRPQYADKLGWPLLLGPRHDD